MKKKIVFAVLLAATIAMAVLVVRHVALARESTTYRFVAIERGDVESTVTATGTLGAVSTVQVGTQVSGQVSELFVDFNDTVTRGQLLARIDPTLQQQAVAEAAASLERAKAQYLQAQRERDRNVDLLDAGLVAVRDFESADSSLEVARASLRSAEIALQRAKQNLEYTNVYAPIDGVIVDRAVDTGQTVAASLSAPELFLIANDLASMQILADVGEADIGSIQQGQPVRFTVQALARERFEGTVEQVRLQSKTNENVVNYTVVVSVANPEKKLLPGMTARVDFLTHSAADVLKVPNAALRFRPAEDVAVSSPPPPEGWTPGNRPPRGGADATTRARAGAGGVAALHYLDESGEMQMTRVRTGITDGTYTEIRGSDLTEGMSVIAGTAIVESAGIQPNNPFQSNSSVPRQGRAGGF